tara:strand:- start:1791 stop:2825 length:1035 start_codon:yes stop_codon:yes gene_type:complete
LKIKNRIIGPNEFPFVIAEIGINHNGNIEIAKKMVLEAAKSGAECIKHQTHFVEDEMTIEAKNIFPPNANESIWDVIEKNALSKDEEIELKTFTENLGLIYISTPFSRSAADFLAEIDIPAFKIGSGECTNIPLIRHITKFQKPMLLSTGMTSIEDIKKSVELLETSNVDFALLECTNLYPSPPEFVSLRGISELKKTFPNAIIGFSDHSIGPYVALSSIALGACIIERHFTDSFYREGPDISSSMDPSELKIIIEKSKEIFQASKNHKQRTKPEESVFKFARGSIVADQNLPVGKIINENDIWARRPGTGEIPASEFDNLIGRKLKKAICFNQQIKWEDLAND